MHAFFKYFVLTSSPDTEIIEINHMKFLLSGGRERIGLTSESSFYKNAERK